MQELTINEIDQVNGGFFASALASVSGTAGAVLSTGMVILSLTEGDGMDSPTHLFNTLKFGSMLTAYTYSAGYAVGYLIDCVSN